MQISFHDHVYDCRFRARSGHAGIIHCAVAETLMLFVRKGKLMHMLRKMTSMGVLAFGLGFATAVHAADTASEPQKAAPAPANEWAFTVAPYLWGAGLSGDVGLFGQPPVNLDLSFDDLLNHLKFAAMLAVEAHNGTWGVAGDLLVPASSWLTFRQ